MDKKLSYYSLEPHLKNLRFCGFYQLSSNLPELQILLHKMYMRLVLFLILMYTVQQIIKVYQVRSDTEKVMDTMFLLLTNSDSIYKQCVLWIKADQIEELLLIMKGPLFNQSERLHQQFLSRTVRRARLVLRLFNNVALSTCLLWTLYPVILYMQGKPVEFAIWLPFDANMSPQFYFAAVYVWVQTSWLAFNNTTMDAFISFFLAQCKTQLSILRLDLENVAARSKEEAIASSKSETEILQGRFIKILTHYQEIVNYANKIQDIFGGALLYQFLVGGWILCTTAHRTVNMNPASMEFISMIMYMSCILTELFLYCFFGNEVYYESVMLIDSAYAMNWLEFPIPVRKSLIIFMERVKRHIEPKAGDFIPLSCGTFLSILRSSYSFYAFLKNTH